MPFYRLITVSATVAGRDIDPSIIKSEHLGDGVYNFLGAHLKIDGNRLEISSLEFVLGPLEVWCWDDESQYDPAPLAYVLKQMSENGTKILSVQAGGSEQRLLSIPLGTLYRELQLVWRESAPEVVDLNAEALGEWGYLVG